MTYTFAELEVSPAVYDEVRAKLVEAGYQHAFRAGGDEGELIDMHGIALVRSNPVVRSEPSIVGAEAKSDA